MKFNYPIKYATMPIRNYDIVCYIVSKCYLLSDKTKYIENGKSVKEYEVVFPYQMIKKYNWNRVIPEFNLINVCTNLELVEEVFDNYEQALENATKKNKELCDKNLLYLPYTEDFEEQISKTIEEFNDELSRYKMLEQQISIHTSDLKQANVRELNQLIRRNKGKLKVLSSNLYEYLKFSSNFIVYSISKDQYDKLLEFDNLDDCDVQKIIGNANPILYNQEPNLNIMVIDEFGNVLYYINKFKVLMNVYESISSVDLEAIDDEIDCLFTTETLEDILSSFNSHEDIDLYKIQGPILKKTLFDRNKK